MKNTTNSAKENPDFAAERQSGKWLSRIFLLFSAGLLLYVSLLCYPSWPSSLQKAISDPENTTVYQKFSDFTSRLKNGDGVLAAFAETCFGADASEVSD